MPRLLTGLVCTTLLLLLRLPTSGQATRTDCRIYHVRNRDGSVAIFGENKSPVPYTVAFLANLEYMQSTTRLPIRVVLFPFQPPLLLTTFVPYRHEQAQYRYSFIEQLGIYTGHAPDTSYVYPLPYELADETVLPERTLNANIYGCRLPAGTPICASRAGTVAVVQDRRQKNFNVSSTVIRVLHADGSYASYGNSRAGSAAVRVGQQVAPGQLLSYSGGRQYENPLWFSVECPGDTIPFQVPVVFRRGTQRLPRRISDETIRNR